MHYFCLSGNTHVISLCKYLAQIDKISTEAASCLESIFILVLMLRELCCHTQFSSGGGWIPQDSHSDCGCAGAALTHSCDN